MDHGDVESMEKWRISEIRQSIIDNTVFIFHCLYYRRPSMCNVGVACGDLRRPEKPDILEKPYILRAVVVADYNAVGTPTKKAMVRIAGCYSLDPAKALWNLFHATCEVMQSLDPWLLPGSRTQPGWVFMPVTSGVFWRKEDAEERLADIAEKDATKTATELEKARRAEGAEALSTLGHMRIHSDASSRGVVDPDQHLTSDTIRAMEIERAMPSTE